MSVKRRFMQRRTFVTFAAASTATLAMPVMAGAALAEDDTDHDSTDRRGREATDGLDAALRRFLALPGTKSYLIHVGQDGALRRIAHQPDLFLFTASAYKTFVLGQYLRDVEAGLLSEDEQLAIDDSARTSESGIRRSCRRTTARSVLEGMIAHSDNMATDIAAEGSAPTGARAQLPKPAYRLSVYRTTSLSPYIPARRRHGPRLAGDRNALTNALADLRSTMGPP
jgi:beta-lactamase class A